jgi:hypothetical protein
MIRSVPEPGAGLSADTETAVLQLVRDDPFATIGELKSELNRRSEEGASWWFIFSILRRHGLLRRRSRFRFARGR